MYIHVTTLYQENYQGVGDLTSYILLLSYRDLLEQGVCLYLNIYHILADTFPFGHYHTTQYLNVKKVETGCR